MNMINSLIIEGTLKNLEEIENGVSFQVAYKETFKNHEGKPVEEEVFFDCIAFGTLGEFLRKKGKSGAGIRIAGRLKQSRFTNSTGKLCSKIVVLCEHIEFKYVRRLAE